MSGANCRRDGWTTWTTGRRRNGAAALTRLRPHGLEDLGEERILVEWASHISYAQGPEGADERPAFLQIVLNFLELPALDLDLIEEMLDVAPAGELQLLPLDGRQTVSRIDALDRPSQV